MGHDMASPISFWVLFGAFVALFILPGVITVLLMNLGRRVYYLGLVSIGFFISFVLLALVAFVGLRFAFPFDYLLYSEYVIALVSALGLLFLFELRKPSLSRVWRSLQRSLHIEDLVVIGVALATGIFMLLYGGFIEFGDVWVHVAYITKFLTHGVLTPEYPFFKSPVMDLSYGYCAYHPVLASLAYLLNRDVLFLWYYLPALLAPMVIICNYYFAIRVTRSRFVGLLAVLFLFYNLAFQIRPLFGFSFCGYPGSFGVLILLPLLWILTFNYLRGLGWRDFVFAGIGFLGLLTVHKLVALYFSIDYFLLAILLLIYFRGRRPNQLGVLKLMVLFGVLGGAYVLFTAPIPPVVNPLHVGFRAEEMVQLTRKSFIANPRIFLFQMGIVMAHLPYTFLSMLGILLLPFLLIDVRRNGIGKCYLISATMAMPLILFNPLLLPLLKRWITLEGAVRIVQTVPYFILIPYTLYLIIQTTLTSMYRTLRSARNRVWINLFLFALFLGVTLIHFSRDETKQWRVRSPASVWNADPLFPAAQVIQREGVKGKKLISDLPSSYVVGALSGVEVLGIPETMSSPSHNSVQRKNQEVYTFFLPDGFAGKEKFLKEHDVKYVLLNRLYLRQDVMDYFVDHLRARADLFHLIYQAPGVLLYRMGD